MTRIHSAIPPQLLTDVMLKVEFRELPRVSTAAWDFHRKYSKWELPTQFVQFGKSHTEFFFDKGDFVHARYDAIANELWARGLTNGQKKYVRHPQGFRLSHVPDQSELDKCIDYIVEHLPITKLKITPYLLDRVPNLSHSFGRSLIHGFGTSPQCDYKHFLYCRACGETDVTPETSHFCKSCHEIFIDTPF